MKSSIAVLDPKTYTSPSGEFSLLVDPQDPSGAGGAMYRLCRRGTTVWAGNRPYTLWSAGVTDAGVAAGYAYSSGLEGWGPRTSRDAGRDRGDFQVVILDARGRERMHRGSRRVESHFEDGNPQPEASGLLLDGAQDRFVVRVADPDVNRQVEEWRVYQLSIGREVRHFAPKNGLRGFEAARNIVDARFVAGTPLVLIQWWLIDGRSWTLGARFSLIDLRDPSARPVWTLDLPRDYNVPGNERAQDALMDEIRRTGAILAASHPQEFTLRFVARKLRVTFRVAHESGKNWNVRQVRAAPYVVPIESGAPKVPSARLALRDRIDLLDDGSEKTSVPNPVRRPNDLIAAGPGKLAFLRLNDDPALVVVTEAGNVLHQVPLSQLRNLQSSGVPDGFKVLWQEETRFVVFRERCPDEEINSYTEAFVVDAASGVIMAIAGFRCPPIIALASFPGGGFVVLADVRAKYTSKSEVYAYDAFGKRTWALTRDFGYGPNEGPEMLFDPQALAVLHDGSVAVLDNIRNTVQFYGLAGHYQCTLALEKAWKRKPTYVSSIVADPGGGFVIHDFDGTSSAIWMNADSSVARSLSPRYESGAPIDNPKFCVASDRQLRVNDGYSLLRLDSAGTAVARIGDLPDASRLEEISEVVVQPEGRILVAAERTGAVHVLDKTGRRLQLCLPKGGAAEASPSETTSISLGPAGTFAIEDQWFDSDGKPCGKPAGFHTARERSAALLRRPNRTWLGFRKDCNSSSDGALAILDQPQSFELAPGFVSLYSPGNAPISTIPVPAVLGALAAVALDGKQAIIAGCRWAYCYRSNGQPIWRFALPLPPGTTDKAAQDISWRPFLVDGGRTLCLFDGVRFLYGYAMP